MWMISSRKSFFDYFGEEGLFYGLDFNKDLEGGRMRIAQILACVLLYFLLVIKMAVRF